ncbi:MAG: hypothetical protein A2020_14775 [Lentisphaerae bacterium GWF2_45_14]|nr:MAG: hypothetical protein A2020_14775 [Lentisphaerae bacterium GWF2_45_14]
MANSRSEWMINPETFGITLEQLVATDLPEWQAISTQLGLPLPPPSQYTAGPVDDFSPDFDAGGAAMLNIVPFTELEDVIQNGDVIVFMEKRSKLDFVEIIKQRGWHSEIAFRDAEGKAFQSGPWCPESEIQAHRCVDLAAHRKYDPSRWNLHIFRMVKPPEQSAQIEKLLLGVQQWGAIFHHFTFPPGGGWFLDPVDFTNITELEEIARKLIRSESVNNVLCIQWVNTVLSLALNVPLTRTTLTRLGVLEVYEKNFARLGCADENVQPLGRFPLEPYSPQDLIAERCKLYFRMTDAEVGLALPLLMQSDKIRMLLRDAPSQTILPITPFTEYRNGVRGGAIKWEYVATTFAKDQCRQKYYLSAKSA